MLWRFKEEIEDMASLVVIQGVVFSTLFITLLETTGEEAEKIWKETVFSQKKKKRTCNLGTLDH